MWVEKREISKEKICINHSFIINNEEIIALVRDFV